MSAAVGLTLGFSTDLQGFPRLEPPWFGNGTWNSNDRAWWHNTLHEAGIAQADVIAPVTRSENPRGDNSGQAFGMAVPGFVDPSNPARRIDRRDGAALREAFDAFDAARTRVVLLEGLTDWEECAGFYRSDAWTHREQYLDIVRARGDQLPALTTT